MVCPFRHRALLCFSLALALPLGACKERQQQPPAAEPPPAASIDAGSAPLKQAEKLATVKVWFLDQERMKTGTEPLFVPVEREVPEKSAMNAALEALFAGPTEAESSRGLRFVNSGASGFEELRVADGVAHVRLTGGCNSGGSTSTIAAEIVPTLKQFPEVQAVKIYDPSGKTEEPEGRTDSIPFCLEP